MWEDLFADQSRQAQLEAEQLFARTVREGMRGPLSPPRLRALFATARSIASARIRDAFFGGPRCVEFHCKFHIP